MPQILMKDHGAEVLNRATMSTVGVILQTAVRSFLAKKTLARLREERKRRLEEEKLKKMVQHGNKTVGSSISRPCPNVYAL